MGQLRSRRRGNQFRQINVNSNFNTNTKTPLKINITLSLSLPFDFECGRIVVCIPNYCPLPPLFCTTWISNSSAFLCVRVRVSACEWVGVRERKMCRTKESLDSSHFQYILRKPFTSAHKGPPAYRPAHNNPPLLSQGTLLNSIPAATCWLQY